MLSGTAPRPVTISAIIATLSALAIQRSTLPSHFKKQKLYCYVDETGQDTKGELFIVSVVVVGWDRDALAEQLEMIERETQRVV